MTELKEGFVAKFDDASMTASAGGLTKQASKLLAAVSNKCVQHGSGHKTRAVHMLVLPRAGAQNWSRCLLFTCVAGAAA